MAAPREHSHDAAVVVEGRAASYRPRGSGCALGEVGGCPWGMRGAARVSVLAG